MAATYNGVHKQCRSPFGFPPACKYTDYFLQHTNNSFTEPEAETETDAKKITMDVNGLGLSKAFIICNVCVAFA